MKTQRKVYFADIKDQVEKNEKLYEQLGVLYDSCTMHGMRIPEETIEGRLDFSIAIKYGLIENETYTDRWRIQPDNLLLAYYVLKLRLPEIEDNLPRTITAFEAVFEKSTKKIDTHRSIRFLELGQKVLELLLRMVNECINENFNEWIHQLSGESRMGIGREFMERYCAIADDLNLTGEEIASASRHFFSWEDEFSNIEVSKMLMRYAIQDEERATMLFQSLGVEERNIKSGLLAGLLRSNYEKGKALADEMFKAAANQAYVLAAIRAMPIETPEIGIDMLNLILSYDRMNELNRLNMPYTLSQMMENANFQDFDFVQKCYEELNGLAVIEHLQTAQTVLNSLKGLVKKHAPQTIQTLKILLKNPIIEHEHIGKLNYSPSFDSVLQNIKDAELLFDFFDEYARCYSTQFSFETFYTTITNQCYSIDSKPFREKVFNCLIHDEGSIRLFGNRIIDFFSHYNHNFEFHTDISQLPPISQYKLWMSVLHTYKKPKDFVPLLLPLLKSNEPIVAEAFLCKLEELTECFHEDLIYQVEQNNKREDEKNSYVANALERISSHYAKFCNQLDLKNELWEFQPLVSQTNAFNRFNELYRSKMNESIDMSMKKSGGLISLAQKVVLAKGGGWKMRNQDEIRKLGHVQTSYIVPRFYFINPEKFEWEFQNNILSSWWSDKIDFIEWITE